MHISKSTRRKTLTGPGAVHVEKKRVFRYVTSVLERYPALNLHTVGRIRPCFGLGPPKRSMILKNGRLPRLPRRSVAHRVATTATPHFAGYRPRELAPQYVKSTTTVRLCNFSMSFSLFAFKPSIKASFSDSVS